MIRVLRFPRLFAAACAASIACALARDVCLDASLYGYAQVLLYATMTLLLLAIALMSCRFFVDAQGIGVGSGLRMRRIAWSDVASLGLLYCNGHRRYLYGMERGHTDFLNLLHHAPFCGPWGFVVPLNKRLLAAVCAHCPFELNLSHVPAAQREGRMRRQWHYAASQMLLMLPTSSLALLSGGLMLYRAAHLHAHVTVLTLTLSALALVGVGLSLLYRLTNTLLTCPGFNKHGISTGRALYLPWDAIRFGYVHRIAKMSGLYLLSQPHTAMQRRGAPPVVCLSMPDTSTLLLAYLTYCPHADKGMQE